MRKAGNPLGDVKLISVNASTRKASQTDKEREPSYFGICGTTRWKILSVVPGAAATVADSEGPR